jgi:hypothetical protein
MTLNVSSKIVSAIYENITPEPEPDDWDHFGNNRTNVSLELRKAVSFGTIEYARDDSLTHHHHTMQKPQESSEKTEVQQEDVLDPEDVRQQLIEFERKRKEEVQEQIKKSEAFLLDQLRDINYEVDDRLRRIRTKHAHDYLERINRLNDSLNACMEQVVQNANKISVTDLSSPEIDRRLKEVQNRQKQLQSQKIAQQTEQRRLQRIQAIKASSSGSLEIIEKCLAFLKKCLEDQRYEIPAPLKSEFVELTTYLTNVSTNLTSLASKNDPTDYDLESVSKYSNDILTTRKKLNEGKKKLQEHLHRKQEEANAAASQPVVQTPSTETPITVTPTVSKSVIQPTTGISAVPGLKEYATRQKFAHELEEKLKPFSESTTPEVKTYRLKLQQFIRTHINAICPESNDHLRQKYQKLALLFEGKDIEYQDVRYNTKNHPLANDFCMVYAAKTFISVATRQVMSVPKSCFGFGAIISLLWSRFPSPFGQVFLSLLTDKCPYIVGYYPPRGSNESEIDHLVACGYTFGADQETLETQESFLNRMRTCARLYGAVIASRSPLSDHHPHGMKNAWTFLATTLSIEPRSGTTAAVLHAFLSVTVHRLLEVYKNQFVKLLVFILRDYMTKIEANSSQDTKKQSGVQLKMLLEDSLKKILEKGARGIKPEGVLSDYFWQKSYLHS